MTNRSPAHHDTIYLDHAATSPLRPEVWEAMGSVLGEADRNPASPHLAGQRARHHLESARRSLLERLTAPGGRLHFTAGGTVSDNLAVLGFARRHAAESPRILVSSVEHHAVLQAAERAAREGARVERLPVDGEGILRLGALEARLREVDGSPTLVSVMWANNEIGTVQPVGQVARLCREHGARFHTDAVQALGKLPLSLDPDRGGVAADLVSITAHKLGGPVGIGALWVADGVELAPLTHGGSQEGGLWPGTQNAVGAVGFARAVELAVSEREAFAARTARFRDGLEDRLRERVPDLRVHGGGAERRLPQLLSVGIPACDTSALLVSLDLEGIAASSGSACSSESAAPSHVLEAMGITADPADYAVLRLSLGPSTSEEEVERVARLVPKLAARLRRDAAGAGATRGGAGAT